jgi:two-component system, OmpR family, response regulator VanR
MRVLIVEDEPYMAEAIRDGLRLEAIAADVAGDGDTALELLSINAYDIAVLDRDIPGPSGDEIAKHIVASGGGMPILMLTAADRLDDKATGFELGADDYLTKPFELRELVLRLRRSTAGASTTDHPCERSQACVWIRSAARSTATAATSR